MTRASSGRDLMTQLGQAAPRLLCSLVHKFGRKGVDDFEQLIKDLEAQPCPTVGEVFVFVDECHRTQSGKLHRTIKALMPNRWRICWNRRTIPVYCADGRVYAILRNHQEELNRSPLGHEEWGYGIS